MIAAETKPAFEGFIANTQDALLVFEGESVSLARTRLAKRLT